MLSYLRGAFVLVFVAFPLLEIAVLIKIGQAIGFWPTMLLLICAAVLGGAVIRGQGLSALARVFDAMREGRLPFEPMLDSYVVIMAGLMLIVPGFISDAMALLLLIPPLRRWGIRRVIPDLNRPPLAAEPGRPIPRRPTII